MPADAGGGVGAVVCVVDVDETAPVLGEFLMTNDAAEPPDGGLVDGAQWGSGDGLRVGGDEVEAGLDGVLLGERFDEPKNGEGAELMVLSSSVRPSSGGHVEWPTVHDAREVAFTAEVAASSSPIWSGHRVHQPRVGVRRPAGVRPRGRDGRGSQFSAMVAPTPAASARTSQDLSTRDALALTIGVVFLSTPLDLEEALVDSIG